MNNVRRDRIATTMSFTSMVERQERRIGQLLAHRTTTDWPRLDSREKQNRCFLIAEKVNYIRSCWHLLRDQQELIPDSNTFQSTSRDVTRTSRDVTKTSRDDVDLTWFRHDVALCCHSVKSPTFPGLQQGQLYMTFVAFANQLASPGGMRPSAP